MSNDDGVTPNDEYFGLLEAARDALHALMTSEPDADATLRVAYADLGRLIGERQWMRDRWEERRREQAWKAKPASERDHLLLKALGDDRLSIRELVHRLNEHSDCRVYDPDVRRVVRRLFDRGDLLRVNDATGAENGAVRYRYSRNTELSGPVAGLEHAFHGRGES